MITLVKNSKSNIVIECVDEIQNDESLYKPGSGLYIWTMKSLLNNVDVPLKVGQYGSFGKGKLPQETIKSYLGATIDSAVILYSIRFADNFFIKHKKFKTAYDIEHEVHRRILKIGYHIDTGSSTESFGGVTVSDVKKIINDVLFGVQRLENYTMRPEQQEAHDKIVKYYQKGNKEFLLAAKMRYGKNFTFLNVIKTLKYKKALVITYKPSVFDSLKDDITNHINFDNWDIVNVKEYKKNNNQSNTQIFVSSAQLALYKDSETEHKKNLKKIKGHKFDLIIADEYHYGTKSENFKQLLSELTYDKILWVSGTAMRDIESGRFDEDQIFSWSYIDEQQKKREGSRYHQMMPTMNIHLMTISEEAKKNTSFYQDEEGFTMTKMIATDINGKLKDAASLQLLLEQIAGSKVHKKMSPYRSISGLNHTFWVVPKHVAGIKAMAELMRKMPEYKNYHIMVASGGEVTDINKVKEAINKYSHTITLSCYRFKEGVTIPKWNGVMMLDDGRSIEEYLQAIFRSQSPNVKDNKENCYVFDFNPQRCLQMVYDVCENIDKTGNKKLSDTIREFLDYCPILDHFENKLKPVNSEDIINNFYNHGNFSAKFANEKNFDFTKINDDIVKSISSIKAEKQTRSIEISNNNISLGKNLMNILKKEQNITNKKEKDNFEEIKKRVKTVLARIPNYLFITEVDEETVNDIINTNDPDLFFECVGITINEFKTWVELGFVNTVLLNRNIKYFLELEAEKF